MERPDPLEPLRAELTPLGFHELRTAADVEQTLARGSSGLLVIHSVCPLSAEVLRPALAHWLLGEGPRPEHLWAILAGADGEAALRARRALRPHRPSAPQIAFLVDGRPAHVLQRADIAAHDARSLAAALAAALASAT